MVNDDNNNKTYREMMTELVVSAAVQESQLATVIITLDKHCDSDEHWREAMSVRMRSVEGELRTQEERLKNQIRTATGLNAVYATVMAAIATCLSKAWS